MRNKKQLTERQQELFDSLVNTLSYRDISVELSDDGEDVIYRGKGGRIIAREAVEIVLAI